MSLFGHGHLPGFDGATGWLNSVDGAAPGDAHGLDTDEHGGGTVDRQRLYQLVREPGEIRERTFEIAFDASGVEAYVFTFG